MKLYFKTYCNKTNLKQVREFVRESFNQQGIVDPDAYMMILAVDEICSNLMIHSNNCDSDKQIDLMLHFLGNQLSITIKDYGLAFNYEAQEENQVEKLIAEKRKGGLGLLLVKKIMDEVHYETSLGQNCWVLSKNLKPV
jgi:serine/threonine-protein kinase RsbW